MRLDSQPPLLTADHRLALDWFRSHASDVVGWPQPLNGLFLANKAKGIHKPASWKYALSIRLALDGPYHDVHDALGGGAWELSYSQEGDDPGYFTNRALLACMEDGVPIGVLKQVQVGPPSMYKVLGLGYLHAFTGKQFEIRSTPPSPSGNALQALFKEFDAVDLEDVRTFRVGKVANRQGQPAFREALMRAYEGRCAVSNCAVPEALEAAHILFYRGIATNHIQNGILLRSDIHALFDAGLMSITMDYRISIDPILKGSEYSNFEGAQIRLPANELERPSAAAIGRRNMELNAQRRNEIQ